MLKFLYIQYVLFSFFTANIGLVIVYNAQLLLITLMTSLFYSSVLVHHDSKTMSQHARYPDTETKAAKCNSTISHCFVYTGAFSSTCQKVEESKYWWELDELNSVTEVLQDTWLAKRKMTSELPALGWFHQCILAAKQCSESSSDPDWHKNHSSNTGAAVCYRTESTNMTTQAKKTHTCQTSLTLILCTLTSGAHWCSRLLKQHKAKSSSI